MSVNRVSRLRVEPTERDTLLPEIDMGDVLHDIFAKFRRRWYILAAFIGGSILLSVIYVVTATAVYTANGAILIDPRVGQNPESGQQVSTAVLISDALTVDSELRVLTSREVTNTAMAELNIQPEEQSGPGLRQQLITALGLGSTGDGGATGLSAEDRAARETEARRRNFVNNLRVQRAGDSFVIDLSYTSSSPAFAAMAVNTLMRQYLLQSGRQQIAMVERNQSWLQGRITELAVEVEATETAVAEYRRINNLLAIEGQLLPTEFALNAAVEELVRLRGAALATSVQAEQLAEQIEAGQIDAVRLSPEDRDEALGEFEARYAELQQREKELLLSWDETAPIVVSVRQQLAQTRELIIDEYRQALTRLITTSESLNRQVVANQQVIDELRDEYGDDARKTVELRRLEREAEAKRELYERLLEEFNSISQLLTFDATSARVIAWAVPPDRKSAPQSRQLVLLAAFAGLVLAIGTILLLEALDSSFRKQVDISRDLGLRFLGMIPSFSSEKDGRGALGGLLPGKQARRSGRWRNLPRSARWIDFAANNPTSHAADTMRMVHAQLAMKHSELADREEGLGVVIGITSSVHGEGKTMTSANLANFLARRHERVVLVDLDLITRQLSRLVEPILPEANNLSSFIDNVETAIGNLEAIPELPGLAIIGNADGNVPDYVTPRNSELLDNMLKGLRRYFDYVIVDLPPAQGTADTQLLATICDGLIYAVRWGKTPRDQVTSSLRQRGISKAQIFGVLFTQAPVEQYRSYNRHDVNEYYA
ncbi:MAG: AAA family ATPase [Jannaschia sp.]